MNTIAWVMILIAVLLIRAVSRGRVMNLGEDTSDAFLAIINGKYDDLSEVLSRTGDSATPTNGEIDLGEGTFQQHIAGSVVKGSLSQIVQDLGGKAKGYRLGGAGPDYYDCSGLVYRGVQKQGFTGPRFWTGSIRLLSAFHPIPDKPAINDIVLWPGHHMGVVTGPNRFYSARNPRSGIGESNISGFRKESPVYLRFTGK